MKTLRTSRRNVWLGLMGGAALLAAASAAFAQLEQMNTENSIVSSDHPAIAYLDKPTTDAGARLSRRLERGETKLEYQENGLGYLPSLLKELGVNPDSQALVFSKTSFQAVRISPRAPRALYFNDDTMVGYVQGSDVLELATLDPQQGYVFYTFENVESGHPVIDRRDVCLQCHHGPATAGIPGIMVASVYPDSSGMPFARLGMPATDHRTRFQDRWGGWYVTGTHGGQHHQGNAMARDRQYPDILDIKDTQNLTDLSKKFDTSPYLRPTSDIVALMTLEHQTRMTNLLTRVGWEGRIADYDHAPQGSPARLNLEKDIETVVTYMLFADEAPLLDRVSGVSTYTQTFPQRGPRDAQGRSLRDFDLKTRLFRYPLSYMIYSDVFDNLPESVRGRIYQRLYDVLTSNDPGARFRRLSAQDRSNVLAIVRDTKKGLPEYWR
ncbi:MAG: hypothetical protein ABI811_21130 [Acidobacteriota bacterium]